MFSIVLILTCSIVLFAYWFRYSCLLILQTRSREALPQRVQGDGNGGEPEALSRLHRDLSNNYRMMRFLLSQTNDVTIDPIERRMLLLDYHLMSVWYFLTHRISESQARHALDEMSTIVSFFSQSAGVQPGRARI